MVSEILSTKFLQVTSAFITWMPYSALSKMHYVGLKWVAPTESAHSTLASKLVVEIESLYGDIIEASG